MGLCGSKGDDARVSNMNGDATSVLPGSGGGGAFGSAVAAEAKPKPTKVKAVERSSLDLVLLGPGGSGKSTIFRQMQM